MKYALRYRRLWLAYLLVSVGATAVVVGFHSALNEDALLHEVGGSVISVLYLVPLYGYVQQKRIRPRWLWVTLLIVAGTATLVVFSFALVAAFLESTLLPVLIWAAIAALVIPNLFAIHQYVHSRHIWGAT